MRLHDVKVFLLVAIFLFCGFFFTNSVYGYACGEYCAWNPAGCVAGTVCVNGYCGQYYNTCSGATCQLNTGWNQSTCNSVGCGTAPTTNTSSFSACTVTCGVGTKTCNCNILNNCPITCSGGVACGVTNTACCIDQAPQSTPTITSIGVGTCSRSSSMTVNWDFSDTGSNCNLSWGYKCGGNVNTFTIKVDGVNNTTGISSAARTATISTTAIASHQVQVCSSNGFALNCSSAFTVTIDNTAPPVPQPTTTLATDPNCLGKFNLVYSWGAVSDTGCATLGPTPVVTYWSQTSLTPTPAFPNNLFPINTWGTYTSQTTSSSYAPGTRFYTHVRSRDSVDNQSAWSTTGFIVIPSPSPYPTIHVSGPLTEDINRACTPMTLLSSLTLQPLPIVGVTPTCTTPTTSTYDCTFVVDNQRGACVSPNILVTMGGTYSGYGTIGWRNGNNCTGYPVSRNYSIGDSETNIPIYLSYNSNLPTAEPSPTPEPPTITVTPGGPTLTPVPPTATPTPITVSNAAGWFKLKDTSFNSRQSNRQDYVPYYIQTYDSDDSTTNHNIMIGNAGVLFTNTSLQPGANAYVSGTIYYSSNNWYSTNYTAANNVNYLKYIDYIKARKDFKILTTLPLTSASFPTNGIYSISENVDLDPTWFDGKNIVLVVAGGKTATFNTDFIPPNNGSVAILASNITIAATVTEIDAILIGQTLSTGDSTTPLKIKGNIIDEENGGLFVGRGRSDGSRPSLFVIFNPKIYIDVLPYLSTSSYDWRQVQ